MQDKTIAITTTDADYSVSCENCRYSRNTGKAKLNANRIARIHAHKFPDHVVLVKLTVVIHRWVGYTPKLIPDEDAPPF